MQRFSPLPCCTQGDFSTSQPSMLPMTRTPSGFSECTKQTRPPRFFSYTITKPLLPCPQHPSNSLSTNSTASLGHSFSVILSGDRMGQEQESGIQAEIRRRFVIITFSFCYGLSVRTPHLLVQWSFVCLLQLVVIT